MVTNDVTRFRRFDITHLKLAVNDRLLLYKTRKLDKSVFGLEKSSKKSYLDTPSQLGEDSVGSGSDTSCLKCPREMKSRLGILKPHFQQVQGKSPSR